uniref:Elongator complex protein 1 n=1 Tax=Kalanchoe fedtschenkoi TaxID=63787 RepID=A0A7N0TLN7_KALFE
MKNLKLCSQQALTVGFQSSQPEEALLLSAFDIERNRLFFASTSNYLYTLHLDASQDETSGRESDPSRFIDLEPGDTITAMDYIMEKEALIFGTSNGLLLLHVVDDDATELVGQVEGGVRCIAPSPDGDLLGVITGLGQLLVMTHDWDVLYEAALDEPTEHHHLTNVTSDCTLQSKLSWRGDGKFFATLNDINGSGFLKKLKVWERDSGALHSVSESKAFMGSILDWMPSGAKIAAVYDRKAEDKCPSVVFYERNGLERSSSSINEVKDASVSNLCWNCTSDLLALVVKHESYDSIKIWFLSNNHWYLKQEITYPKHDGVRILWDPVKPLKMICWTGNGLISVYNFIWVTAVMENSLALVIDGTKVMATPLSLALMPPPMFLFSLLFPRTVQDMAFLLINSRNFVAAVLSDGSLSIAELPAHNNWEELEGKELNVEAAYSETPFRLIQHLTWLDSHILLVVNFSDDNSMTQKHTHEHGRYYLQEIEVVCSQDHVPSFGTLSGWQTKNRNRIALESSVIRMAVNPVKRDSALVQLDGGKVFEYTSNLRMAGTLVKRDSLNFSGSCPWMYVATVCHNGLLYTLVTGLDYSGKLHVNGKVICNNCRTFSFYSNLNDQVATHLILTTKQDVLFVVDISDILLERLDEKYENFNNTTRRREENKNFLHVWERGANVIGVLHGDEAAVILQTIRGNLECIYPRKLVLASIVNCLTQGRFKDALLMVRRQRIDFNVIVDYRGWRSFVNSAADFVKQVSNLSHITDFVCSIKNEDVTKILYKDYMPAQSLKKDTDENGMGVSDVDDKMSSVLLAIRKALEEHVTDSPARELCILTTLARTKPPALEEALNRIKATRDLELSNSMDPRRKSRPSAEEALKHLLWLSDTDAVYEAALGLYDLNLAAIVALNSQRDPKEFLPYLEELQQMPGALMRYNIDLKLQRYEKALNHIVSAGDAHYSDCLNLIKKHPHLFPLGYQLITEPAKRLQVLEAWGDHYNNEKCFEDAALTYLCCSNLEKAFKAYRAAGNWSGVFTVAGLLNLRKEEIMGLGHELCEELQSLGKPREAAKVALDYCSDVNCGISLLISARCWEEAMRVAFQYSRDDLVAEVKNASMDCARTLIGEYEEGLEKVGKYAARYLAVRQRRLLLAAKLSHESSVNELDYDTASEVSSTFSGMSAYTNGTSRSSIVSAGSSKASRARGKKRERNKGKIRAGRYCWPTQVFCFSVCFP